MDAIEKFIERKGFGLNFYDKQLILELKKSAKELNLEEEMDRLNLISTFSGNCAGFFLYRWEKYIPNYEILNDDMCEFLRTTIMSVNFFFSTITDTFFYEIDEDFFEERVRSHILKNGDEIFEFFSPAWFLQSKFMDEHSKEQEAKKLIIEFVKNIVKKSNLWRDLYNELPELIKNAKLWVSI